MFSLTAENIPRAYAGLIAQMRIIAEREQTRLGEAFVVPTPFMLGIMSPRERVLFDVERDANPFFHLMEAIWMFSGENEVKWLLQFNKGFSKYAERNGEMHGAYGYRWRYHFHVDQLLEVVRILKEDPTTRRAVIAMWDPASDNLAGLHDYPCNTHIYFRNSNGFLDMTVCNRSNDLIWGMMGSNAVHMTMLHEVIARTTGLWLGVYRVFTNNLHVYTSLPNFKELWATTGPRDMYMGRGPVTAYPIMYEGEDIRKFFIDCTAFVQGYKSEVKSEFLKTIAEPMWDAWQARKAKQSVTEQMIELNRMPPDNDWRKACEEWILRRETLSSSTSTGPSASTSQGQSGTLEVQKENNGTNISPPAAPTSPITPSYSLLESSNSSQESTSGSSPDDLIPF